jgi:hypothetical protein
VKWLNRLLVLPHLARIASLDLPRADLERLRDAVRPGTAPFLGPNHPEFFADAALDRELSARVAPRLAYWLSHEIVDASPLARWLWLRHNIVSNAPGGGGRDYSIRWALAGHGVLLHPEGTASWQSGWVGPLRPGIADLAWETCAHARAAGRDTPVLLVPIVWRMRFVDDVTRGLAREMAHVERSLGLVSGDGRPVGERFGALTADLLRVRCARLGVASDPVPPSGPGYFAAQEAAAAAIVRELEATGVKVERDLGSIMRRVHLHRRVAGGGRERELLLELWRLGGFPRALYDTPMLSQERIAESLKRIRTVLVRRTRLDRLHGVIPVPVGWRVAHVRVPEPIPVHEAFTAGGAPGIARARLLETLRARMQDGLEALAGELAERFPAREVPNPLWSGRNG